jgi:hypothetical protein
MILFIDHTLNRVPTRGQASSAGFKTLEKFIDNWVSKERGNLQHFADKQCEAAPRLMATAKPAVGDERVWFTLMTKCPGRPLGLRENRYDPARFKLDSFWDTSLKERDEIREAFKKAYKYATRQFVVCFILYS